MAASRDSLTPEIIEQYGRIYYPAEGDPGHHADRFDQVYQFKITLEENEWPVWRRFQIASNSTFWGLYVIINNVLLWQYSMDSEFTVTKPGTKENITLDMDSIWLERIDNYLTVAEPAGTCLIGNWMITIELEEICDRNRSCDYPLYREGRGSAPPEYSGPFETRQILSAYSPERKRELSKTRFLVDADKRLHKNDSPYHIDGIDPNDILIDDPDDICLFSYCEMKVMSNEIDDLQQHLHARLLPGGRLPVYFPLRTMLQLNVHGLISKEMHVPTIDFFMTGFVKLMFTKENVAGLLWGIEERIAHFHDARFSQLFHRVTWYLECIQEMLEEA
jgi:hypothetical protein